MSSFIRSLDDIVGHKYIISYLKTRLVKNDVPNVILFNGNPGLGKTSIAKILAIELNGKKESLYESVIDKNESTDCIKLFNMSSVGDDTDLIISELQSTSFSSTGKKVLILDEVHGMTKKAQDAILVTLEYLQKDIYIFMCTTEMSMLRESLVSRCIVFNLNNLSFNEIKVIINRKISERNLKFNMSKELLVNIIGGWSNHQPRKAVNLIESFEYGSYVSQEELSAFISTNNVPIIISLLKYLYGSLVNGIEFLDTLSLSEDFLNTLTEVLKVGLGYRSSMVSENDFYTISNIFSNNNIDNFLYFVIKVNSMPKVSKRVFIASFIEFHASIYKNEIEPKFVISKDLNSVKLADLNTIQDSAMERVASGDVVKDLSDEENKKIHDDVSIERLFNLGMYVE